MATIRLKLSLPLPGATKADSIKRTSMTEWAYTYDHNVRGIGKEIERAIRYAIKDDPNAVIVIRKEGR